MGPKKKDAKGKATKDKKGAKDKKTVKEKKPTKEKAPEGKKPDETPTPPSDPTSLYGAPIDEYTGRFLTHYDNTAGIPLPRTAVEQHLALKHSVVDLPTAFKERYERLQYNLRAKLVPNKLKLESVREKLKKCSESAAATRERIERITKQDADEIIGRLRQAESRRQTAIQHEINIATNELEEIDRIFRDVQMAHTVAEHQNSLLYNPAAGPDPLAGAGGGGNVASAIPAPHFGSKGSLSGGGGVMPPNPALMLHLIQQYPDLQSKIDQLASRVPIIDTEFNTADFPTEVADRLAVISRCDKYAKAIALKDEMLWIALNEKEKLEEKLSKEMDINKEYVVEINKWAEVLQQNVQQLQIEKSEKERLARDNMKLKEMLRKHNMHFTGEVVPPPPPKE